MSQHQTMLYRSGTMITCGPFALDYITVNDEDVKAKLADGWHKTPHEADKAAQDDEEARQAAALQAQIDANDAALKNEQNTATKPKRNRKPKGATDNTEGEDTEGEGDDGADDSENTNPPQE